MKLYLQHGRATLDEALDDWGPEGPTLEGVKGIHQTYGTSVKVYFETPEAHGDAWKKTKWRIWEDNISLEMEWEQDLVAITMPDGKRMYFGDWGIS